MSTSNLHLYVDAAFTSPYAMSVFVALLEKGLPFTLETVDLNAGHQFASSYAATSLTARVPTLVHDGFALSESSAITEYLEEAFPATPLYPADRQARARARQVQAWIRSDCLPIREERSTLVIFYRPSSAPLSADAQAAVAKLFATADALIPADGGNLFGDWCLADLDLAIMLKRLVLNGDPVPEKLARYARRQWERPTVQEWVQQVRPALA